MDTLPNKDDVAVRELLIQTELFSSLGEDELDAVARVMEKQTLAEGAYLFDKGSMGHRLYIVASGTIRICSQSDSGRELTITAFGRGQCIGELSLLDGMPRSTGALAQVDSVLYSLHRRAFQRLLAEYPSVAYQLLAVLSKRLRHTAGLAEQLSFQDVPTRVAVVLQDLAEEFGIEYGGDVLLNISQEEFGSYVSASRKSVNQALGVLSRQGLIEVQLKGICITDAEGLRQHIAAQ